MNPVHSLWFLDLLDIFLVAVLFYRLLILVKGTRSAQMYVGLLVIVLIALAAREFDLIAIRWIAESLKTVWLIAFVILFQPELRHALAQFGRTRYFRSFLRGDSYGVLGEVVRAVETLARDRHGALILTKSRFKHGDPEFIANGSDMVVSDRSYYPFTAFEALSIADLVVTAPSLLVLDALALGKPSIVLRPVHNSARHSMSGLYDEFLYDDGGLFNLKGVTETFSTCTEEGWDRFDSWSKEGGFTRPVLGERDAFMKRYGIEPGASARFFHSIAEMICKKETTAHM